MKRLIVTALLACGLNLGCSWNSEPIERTSNRGIDLLEKALDKATGELSSQSASWIATGALIEPGYRIKIEGGIWNGFKGESEIRIVGATGTMGTATQAGPPSRVVESFGKRDDTPAPGLPTEPVTNEPIALPEPKPE